MPFAIVNRMIEEFNTTGFSSVLRSDNVLSYQMSSSDPNFGLTKHQKDSLAENKVFPIDTGGGTVLVYKASSLDTWNVAHSDIPASPDIGDVKNKLTSTYEGYNFNKLVPVPIEDAMQDGNFKNPYTTASKTWRGGNSGWYDTLSSLNEQIRGYTRSRFWYTATDKLSSSLTTSAKVLGYRKSLAGKAWTRVTGRRTLNEFIGDTMAGTHIGQMLGIKTVNPTKVGSATKIGLTTAALVNGISSFANISCQALQMVSKAQTLIASIQNLQYLNLATGILEAVQSTQVGYSDGEPMREYMEGLTINDDSGKNGMMSDGMSALMTGSTIDESSLSVQAVSSENAMMNIDKSPSGNVVIDALREAATGITNILAAINTCNKVAAGLNVVSTVMSIAIGAVTAGIGSIAVAICQSLVSAAIAPALEGVANAVVKWVWEQFASTIAQNVAVDWVGEDLGNALFSAGDLYIQSQHQIGSGVPASKENVIAYRREQNRIIAEEAEYQRSVRSPFDINSQYTFLGSIVYNLVPIATTSGAGNIIKNIGTLLSDSVSAITPAASAAAETKLTLDFGNCPTLESIGASCDKMGRPFIISDESTLKDYNPKEVVDKINEVDPGVLTPNGDGTYKIRKGSNAEKFLTFCSERLSNWGQSDAHIMEQLDDEARREQWWRDIPLLGDLIGSFVDLFSDSSKNVPWIVGKKCVYSSENAEFWEKEGKYYQAFYQDQRIMENTGAIKESSAKIALDNYHEENPIDNSPEGILARYSGMTKEDVVATIEFIEGMNYIANYNPEERLAFGVEEPDGTVYFERTEDDFARFVAAEPKYIIYDTLRNKATIG